MKRLRGIFSSRPQGGAPAGGTPAARPGYYRGKHFTQYVDEVKRLKREKRNQEAIELLWHLVAATEAESRVDGLVVAPWYYEQLAILFRKQDDIEAEVAVLERYQAASETGKRNRPPEMAERLAKARARLGR